MTDHKYPYIRAFGEMMQCSEYRIKKQIAMALKDNAPADAMWRGPNGTWHCWGEMANHNPNKALIASYTRGDKNA